MARDFAALKLASPSKPSCIQVSIPLIAGIIAQVGILIEAFGSGGVQRNPDSPMSQQLLQRRGPPAGRLGGSHSRERGSSTECLSVVLFLIQLSYRIEEKL